MNKVRVSDNPSSGFWMIVDKTGEPIIYFDSFNDAYYALLEFYGNSVEPCPGRSTG